MEYILTGGKGWLTNKGFESRVISTAGGVLDINLVRTYLSQGYLIIGSQWLIGGEVSHIFVTSGINDNNQVTLQDPASYRNGEPRVCTPNRIRPVDKILEQGVSGNWMYAYAIRRVK